MTGLLTLGPDISDTRRPPLTPVNIASTPDWRAVCELRHNVLLEGAVQATRAALLLFQPHLTGVILRARPRIPLNLPAGACDVLVLEEVAALSRTDQVRLLTWLDPPRGTRVISLSSRPLFPLVARGTFDETLYYRLNVIVMQVD